MPEPFAWYRYQQGDRVYYDSKKWDNCLPLYTHPKEWVGLTANEQSFIYDQVKQIVDSKPFWVRFADVIEAKLKEKNNA